MGVLTAKQAAERLGFVPGTVRRLYAKGVLRGYRIGRKGIRIYEDSLDGLIGASENQGRGVVDLRPAPGIPADHEILMSLPF